MSFYNFSHDNELNWFICFVYSQKKKLTRGSIINIFISYFLIVYFTIFFMRAPEHCMQLELLREKDKAYNVCSFSNIIIKSYLTS